MKMTIRDRMPSGITSRSLAFLERSEDHYHPGRLQRVTLRHQEELEWITEAEYENAILITDGFSAGYGGEGPSGLKRFLKGHGVVCEEDLDPRLIQLAKGTAYSWAVRQ